MSPDDTSACERLWHTRMCFGPIAHCATCEWVMSSKVIARQAVLGVQLLAHEAYCWESLLVINPPVPITGLRTVWSYVSRSSGPGQNNSTC